MAMMSDAEVGAAAQRDVANINARNQQQQQQAQNQYEQNYHEGILNNFYGTQKRSGENYRAEVAAGPAMLAQQNQMARFGTVFPWLQNQFSNMQGQLATAGGASGKSPEITVGGVYNPQQIQQQVNATRAQNDQATGATMKQNAQQMAGQGFGSNSPLLAALNGQASAANLGTNTMAEQKFRNQAAQANAGQTLQSQQAREAQFASRQNEDIERRKPIWQTMNSFIGALGGLV